MAGNLNCTEFKGSLVEYCITNNYCLKVKKNIINSLVHEIFCSDRHKSTDMINKKVAVGNNERPELGKKSDAESDVQAACNSLQMFTCGS